MKAIPGERAMSFSPDLCLMCSAEKLPSMMNVRTSLFLQNNELWVTGVPLNPEVWLTAGIWYSSPLED
jgi:hypothetical protein